MRGRIPSTGGRYPAVRQHRHLRLADPDIDETITVVEGGDGPGAVQVMGLPAVLKSMNRSATLRELGAGIRVGDLALGLPFDCSAESLREPRILRLRTSAGDLDLMFVPAYFPEGYEGLVESAQAHTFSEVSPDPVGAQADWRSRGPRYPPHLFRVPEHHETPRRLLHPAPGVEAGDSGRLAAWGTARGGACRSGRTSLSPETRIAG